LVGPLGEPLEAGVRLRAAVEHSLGRYVIRTSHVSLRDTDHVQHPFAEHRLRSMHHCRSAVAVTARRSAPRPGALASSAGDRRVWSPPGPQQRSPSPMSHANKTHAKQRQSCKVLFFGGSAWPFATTVRNRNSGFAPAACVRCSPGGLRGRRPLKRLSRWRRAILWTCRALPMVWRWFSISNHYRYSQLRGQYRHISCGTTIIFVNIPRLFTDRDHMELPVTSHRVAPRQGATREAEEAKCRM
jgi:hypothetical protein